MINLCLNCGFDKIDDSDNFCRKCGNSLGYESQEKESVIDFSHAKIKPGQRIDEWYVIANDYYEGEIVCLIVKSEIYGDLDVRIIDDDGNIILDNAKNGFKDLSTLQKIDK